MKETVGRSVGMLSNLIRRHFSTFSFHDTLSGTQGKTLHFILARGQECDVFQKDIEEEYSLRPPTATKLLKDMEKNGLIYREAVPYDARLKRIVATKKSHAVSGTDPPESGRNRRSSDLRNIPSGSRCVFQGHQPDDPKYVLNIRTDPTCRTCMSSSSGAFAGSQILYGNEVNHSWLKHF